MGQCNCGKGFFLSLLSLLSLGVIFSMSIFAIYYINYFHFQQISEMLIFLVIASACISFFLLFFSIYASFCGGGCSNFLLGTLFLGFSVGIGFGAYILLTNKNKFLDLVSKAWDDGSKSKDVKDEIEKYFNCSSFNLTDPPEKVSCRRKLDSFLSKWVQLFSIALFFFATLLFIGGIIGYISICSKDNNKTYEPIDQPFSYGW